MLPFIFWFCFSFVPLTMGQIQKNSIDFSKAVPDPKTGQLCVNQQVLVAYSFKPNNTSKLLLVKDVCRHYCKSHQI